MKLPLKMPERLKISLNLNKREKILAAVFLLSAVVFLYYQYIFTVQAEKIAAVREKIKTKEKLIAQLTSLGYNDLAQMKERIHELEADIDKLYAEVPRIKDTPGLLVDFYTLAKLNNITAETITFGKLEVKESYSSFPVSLDVSGTRHEVYGFIKEIEDYPRLSRISKIEFKPAENGMISAKITDEFYVLHEIATDPVEYPFLREEERPDFLFDIFGVLESKSTAGGGNDAGKTNYGATSTEGSGGMVRKANETVEENPYPWIPAQ